MELDKLHKGSVSIVILNYNGYEDTVECINSLLDIESEIYQIILVDNNSPDDSGILLNQKFKDIQRVTFIQSNDNKGYAAGNNIGIEYAISQGAKYVCVLNNDTVVPQNFLENLMEHVIENPNHIISPKILDYKDFHNPNKREIKHINVNKLNFKRGIATEKIAIDTERTFVKANNLIFYGCCFIASSETFKKVGYLNEDYFLYFEEADYVARSKKFNIESYICLESYIYHKWGSSLKRNANLNFKYYYYIRSLFYFVQTYAKPSERKIFRVYFFSINIWTILLKQYIKVIIYKNKFTISTIFKAIKHSKTISKWKFN